VQILGATLNDKSIPALANLPSKNGGGGGGDIRRFINLFGDYEPYLAVKGGFPFVNATLGSVATVMREKIGG